MALAAVIGEMQFVLRELARHRGWRPKRPAVSAGPSPLPPQVWH